MTARSTRTPGPAAVLIVEADPPDARQHEWWEACLRNVAELTAYSPYRVYVGGAATSDPALRRLAEALGCRIVAGEHARSGFRPLLDAAAADGAGYAVALHTDAVPVGSQWLTDLVERLERGVAFTGAWLERDPPRDAGCLATTMTHARREGLHWVDSMPLPAEGSGSPLPVSPAVVPDVRVGRVHGDSLYHLGGHGGGAPNDAQVRDVAAAMFLEHRAEFLAWLAGTAAPSVVYVLGMHRSGTSALMGCLEQCGVTLGAVTRRSVGQPAGNLEQRQVMLINEAMLGAAGGGWRDPPEGVVRPRPADAAEIAQLAAALEKSAPSAVKDPRFLFTLEPWLAATTDPALVGTFRHPVAVARSLWERERIPANEAYELWYRYNRRLVDLHEEHGFPLLEFDLSDRERYCRRVATVASEIGLQPRLAALLDTVQNPPRGARLADDGPVPGSCMATYDYLCRNAYDGRAAPGSFTALVAAWAELQEAPPRRSVGRTAELVAWRIGSRLPGRIRQAVERPVRWVARRARDLRPGRPQA